MDTYNLVYLLTNVFDTYVILRLMQVFFPPESVDTNKATAVYILRFIATSVAYLAAPYPAVSLTVSFSTLFLITLSYKSKISKKIIAAVFAYLTMFTAELILAVIIGISNFTPLTRSDQGNSFCLIISELIALVLVTLLRQFKSSKEDLPMSWGFFFAALFVSAITVYFEIQIFKQENISDLTYALSMICVLMLNFTVFYMYDSLSKSFKEKMQSELAKRETLYYHAQAEMICKNAEELKRFRHDIKNRIIAVEQLLNQGDNNKVAEYLSDITDKLTNIRSYSETGNIAIDSILNYKLTQAFQEDIKIDCRVVIPEDIVIDEDDIIVILGNILDNAIEAAMKCENERYIRLNIRYDQGALLISLKNSFDGKISKSKGKIKTTKSDHEMHGIGLKSVETTVQKYNGKIEINHNENEFEIIIMLIT